MARGMFDIKKRLALCALLGLILTGLTAPARAEELTDKSIRELYAQYAVAMKNDNAYQAFLQQRLDDKYSLQENLTRIVGNNPPQDTSDTYDKNQQILNAIRESDRTHITGVKSDIVGIAFSKDHKLAFVTYTVVTSGTTMITDTNGSYVQGTYDDAEGCVDELTLKDDDLMKIVKSACNGKIVARQ